MKKLFQLLIAFAFLLTAQGAFAQSRFAPQIGYLTDGGGAFIIGVNGEFFLKDKISIQPAFNYYLLNDKVPGYSYSYWSLDADGHYYFTEGSTTVYGLAGFSYAHAGIEYSGGSFSDNEFGLNLGLGANFMADTKMIPFVELKYNSPFESLILTAGLRFGK